MPKGYTTGKMYDLNISQIVTDASQPRKYLDPQALSELENSIKKHGVLQPVIVRSGENEQFILVSGERRYQASVAAGLATLPAVVTDGDPMEISIVENLLREDLTAIEEAEAIESLRNAHSYLLSDLSGILGKAESTLSEILSLTKLPPQVKDDCRQDPKASRRMLVEVARQGSEKRMLASYERFKASGRISGEVVAQKKREKQADAPLDLAFVARFIKRLDSVDPAKLDKAQAEALTAELAALLTAATGKLQALNAQPPS